jgi:hypothetical protein
MPTITKLDGIWAPCAGINHRDGGEIVKCDGCAAVIAKREDGKLFDVKGFGYYHARKFTCWNMAHHCDPAAVAQYTAEKAARLAEGVIVKDCRVRVVKGRKVPRGTEGRVFWIGTDGFDKPKIGFKDDAGATHWTAASNVEIIIPVKA